MDVHLPLKEFMKASVKKHYFKMKKIPHHLNYKYSSVVFCCKESTILV